MVVVERHEPSSGPATPCSKDGVGETAPTSAALARPVTAAAEEPRRLAAGAVRVRRWRFKARARMRGAGGEARREAQALVEQAEPVEHALGRDRVERGAQRHVPRHGSTSSRPRRQHSKRPHAAPAAEQLGLPLDLLAGEVQRLLLTGPVHQRVDAVRRARARDRRAARPAPSAPRSPARAGAQVRSPAWSIQMWRTPRQGAAVGTVLRRKLAVRARRGAPRARARSSRRAGGDLRADSGGIATVSARSGRRSGSMRRA